MKQQFKDKMVVAVTPNRLMSAIDKAVKYCSVSDQQIKLWLESDQPNNQSSH